MRILSANIGGTQKQPGISFAANAAFYTFHRKRAQPDHYGINIFCLDDFDHTSVPVRATDGKDMSVVSEGARDNWLGPRVDR